VDANQPQTAEKGKNLENQNLHKLVAISVYQFWD